MASGGEIDMASTQVEDAKGRMFKGAMEGNWNVVVKEFTDYPQVRGKKLTNTGDTALHLAVSDDQLEIVQMLVDRISTESMTASEILGIGNERGNTPLHLAAASGQVEICEYIANKDRTLISARNHDSETPLFLAALHGEEEAFLCLHEKQPNDSNYSNCIRDDGETVLHCAIDGEHFDLAFKIIGPYKDLVNSNNKKGFTPLHVLASKPSAFKSGSRLGLFDTIIYYFYKRVPTDTENPSEVNQTSRGSLRGSGSSKQGSPLNTEEKHGQMNRSMLWPHELLPRAYSKCFYFFKMMKALLVIVDIGVSRIMKIREKRRKHRKAIKIMKTLLESTSAWEYDNTEVAGSSMPDTSESLDTKENSLRKNENEKGETPVLVAARMGVVEMVDKILDKFPVAIHDLDKDRKNIILLAIQNRQPHVYKHLLDRKMMKSVFRKVDKNGNSALHLAATLGEYRPWLIPGAALQMQWEIKWYKFVKKSMPPNYFVRYNHEGKTPRQVFTKEHKELVKEGGKWLTSTSKSCSVVAALIATMAFATSSSVPGGVKQDTGVPTLEGRLALKVFAICSLGALSFSVTAVIVFLSILTSRHQEKDFHLSLPNKLILGLTSLFLSITSMLVSFCAGHFLVLKDDLQVVAFPAYAVACLPVTLFAAAQFSLYFDLIRATLKEVPQRSYKVILI